MSKEWVEAQLENAGAPQEVKTSVKRLLEVWDSMNHTVQTRNDTLRIFNELARGHAIVKQSDEKWRQCRPGEYAIRDTVRVRLDAYSGEKGQTHNGKRGRVAAVRGRFAAVVYDGAGGETTLHEPEMLERLLP